VYNNRFTVLSKLGWGHFSTVWLSLDAETNEHVALKIQKSAEHYRDAAKDEIELLECVKFGEAQLGEDSHVVKLLDSFEHKGPNGKHVCMVFELLGDNLLTLIKKHDYRGIPSATIRHITRQFCQALRFMHDQCHIIHTDLKPENVLLRTPSIDLPPLPSKASAKAAFAANQAKIAAAGAATTVVKKVAKAPEQGPVQGLAEVDALLASSTITSDERKKLKKKQKRLRQKAKFKAEQSANGEAAAGDGGGAAGGAADGEASATVEAPAAEDAAQDAQAAVALDDIGLEEATPETDSQEVADADKLLGQLKLQPSPAADAQTAEWSALTEEWSNKDDTTGLLLLAGTETLQKVLGKTHNQESGFPEWYLTLPGDSGEAVTIAICGQGTQKQQASGAVFPNYRALLSEQKQEQVALHELCVWSVRFDNQSTKQVLGFLEATFSNIRFLTFPENESPGAEKPPFPGKITDALTADCPSWNTQLFGVEVAENSKNGSKEAPTEVPESSPQPELSEEQKKLNSMFPDVAIVDLGNGCWTHKHFSEDIQTRQYRSPEVIIGSSYDTSADIW
jgi:serine/threonine protein kinase